MPISLEEFEKLSEEKSAAAPSEDLLKFLGNQACTNKEVAAFLGVSPTNASQKMKRLEKKGLVERRYGGMTIYWAVKSEGE